MLQIKQVTSSAELALAQEIRRQVFVEEQGIPSTLEYDAADATALHLVGYAAQVGVATARLVPLPERMGAVTRVAVLAPYRGRGYGRQLVTALETLALKQGMCQLTLHPHAYLEAFYQSLGYQTVPGEVSQVGVHRLIAMVKQLPAVFVEDL
ncbi:MAG: GNAT family N-acetyltransferase [Caldilineaceae bacterium]